MILSVCKTRSINIMIAACRSPKMTPIACTIAYVPLGNLQTPTLQTLLFCCPCTTRRLTPCTCALRPSARPNSAPPVCAPRPLLIHLWIQVSQNHHMQHRRQGKTFLTLNAFPLILTRKHLSEIVKDLKRARYAGATHQSCIRQCFLMVTGELLTSVISNWESFLNERWFL